MTKEEANKILGAVMSYYPNAFKQNAAGMKMVRAIWEETLANDDYEKIGTALKTWIATDTTGFKPEIGWLRKEARAAGLNGPTESEYLAMIRKAASNSNYNAATEFAKLPEVCKRAVGDVFQLQQWAMTDSDDFDTVVMSRIRRAMSDVITKQEHVDLIPEPYKEKLGIDFGRLTKELETDTIHKIAVENVKEN